MNITIIGATGFIGRNLTQHLLTNTKHHLTLVAPNADKIKIDKGHAARITRLSGSVLEVEDMKKALSSADVAVYLVHMMASTTGDYADLEASAAEITGKAAQEVGLPHLIYMSGLGKDQDNLSKHLASRHKTGDIFRKHLSSVAEFRASMVIGEGSISFDIVKHLIHKLPILLLPRWVITKTQPIGLHDILLYLTEAVTNPIQGHEIVEVGGPGKMTYLEFLRKYATWAGKKRLLIRIVIIPTWLAGWWLDLFTPRSHAKVGRAMVESFKNEMVVTNNRARELFPHISPRPVEEYFS